MRSPFRAIRSIKKLQELLGNNIQVEQIDRRSRGGSPVQRPYPAKRKANRKQIERCGHLKASKPPNTRRSFPRGTLNRSEKSFLEWLRQERWTQIGFETIRIELAHRCWYTPDLIAFKPGEKISFFEVKGFWEDDARVKIKVAARLLPKTFAIKTAVYKNKKWQIRAVNDPHSKITPQTAPKMELLHSETGNQLLSLPIQRIHVTLATKTKPPQMRLTLHPREVETAFLRYILYLEKGRIPTNPLSTKALHSANSILKHKRRNNLLKQFRTRWEDRAFAAPISLTLKRASDPTHQPKTLPGQSNEQPFEPNQYRSTARR